MAALWGLRAATGPQASGWAQRRLEGRARVLHTVQGRGSVGAWGSETPSYCRLTHRARQAASSIRGQ